ncbi:MAG: hypothetical protein WCJ71_11590 [Candidatus Omnitrophota bacterium]
MMDKAIDLNQQETWPEEIVDDLNVSLTMLRAHEKDRRRVDKLCENDVFARVNPPEVRHSGERALLLKRIDSCLNDCFLLGFHCTRFHESEIEVVKKEGLKPLSEELAYGRVRRLQEIGALPPQVALRLLSENVVNNRYGKRLGRLCFIFSRSSLKDKNGVFKLLSYWGGEALYRAHTNDQEVAPVLKTIGHPCIVQAAIPIAMLNTRSSVSDKLVSLFLRTRGIATTDDGLFEDSIDQVLDSKNIQRIIEYGETEFEMLTGCEKWRCCLTSSS